MRWYNAAMTWKNLAWLACAAVSLLIGIVVIRHALTLSDDPFFEKSRNLVGGVLIASGIIGIVRVLVRPFR
jgi:uncharacterized membrane protein YvlD (DUF360 family)